MKQYSYTIDMPHSAGRIWTAMQDYDKWPDFAKPMVTGISIVEKGDEKGNGLVRQVHYKLPLGLKGKSLERVHDVEPGIGYTYTTRTGTVGIIKLEKVGPNSTRLHFTENVKYKFPFSLFEGKIQKFVEKYNRKTMENMSNWLTEHPEYPGKPG